MAGLVEVRERGATSVVSLARPEALNALTVGMLEELANLLERLSAEPSVRVVVLTGSGRAFCAGVDLKELQHRSLSGGRVGSDFDDAAARVTELLSSMPQPTIAAVNGACFTGGLELALACDLVIAADEAVLGDTHARWGLRPTWGMTQRLVRAVGWPTARLMSYTGRNFSGSEAVEYGLAVESVPLGELDDHVARLGEEITANSAAALAAYKNLYALAGNTFLDEGLKAERESHYEIPDTRERLEQFASRRPARDRESGSNDHG